VTESEFKDLSAKEDPAAPPREETQSSPEEEPKAVQDTPAEAVPAENAESSDLDSDIKSEDITATGEVRRDPEQPEFTSVQPVAPEVYDQSKADSTPLGAGGQVADDTNKEGAPATTQERGNVASDFEAAIKERVEQYDQNEVAANTGPRPLGIPEANQVVVVEPQADQSGYVIDTGEHNAQPYAVQKDSVLSGEPWNIQPGTIIGRSQNPPLTDELARELGLDKIV
jgi:hypothetical protein